MRFPRFKSLQKWSNTQTHTCIKKHTDTQRASQRVRERDGKRRRCALRCRARSLRKEM